MKGSDVKRGHPKRKDWKPNFQRPEKVRPSNANDAFGLDARTADGEIIQSPSLSGLTPRQRRRTLHRRHRNERLAAYPNVRSYEKHFRRVKRLQGDEIRAGFISAVAKRKANKKKKRPVGAGTKRAQAALKARVGRSDYARLFADPKRFNRVRGLSRREARRKDARETIRGMNG